MLQEVGAWNQGGSDCRGPLRLLVRICLEWWKMLKLGPDRLVLLHQTQIGQSTTELLAFNPPTWQRALHAISYTFIYTWSNILYIYTCSNKYLHLYLSSSRPQSFLPSRFAWQHPPHAISYTYTCYYKYLFILQQIVIQTSTNSYTYTFVPIEPLALALPTVPSQRTLLHMQN